MTPKSPPTGEAGSRSAKYSATVTYESLAHKGETMTTAAMVTYAYDQIDQARAELNAVSKWTTIAPLGSSSEIRRLTTDER